MQEPEMNLDQAPNGMPPDGEPGGAPGGQGGSDVSHVGATELTESETLSDQSYSSTSSSENALLVSGATVNLSNPTIGKTGDDSGDSADFYGTNAAVFAYNNAVLNITGGTITTNGSHANAVFAYDTGTINITKTNITTSSNNSGGIMVTGGGTLTATDLTVETYGNSSAPIRSDRGGGTLTVEGGNYTSNGVGSPAIYSTANIIVRNATLTATASEGIVIEGLNSVTLDSTTVTDTNNQLNGNSETYKNIFIYQSMSGDAEVGVGSFTATNSTFVTNQGDHFFITNTKAIIFLTNSKFTNNDPSGAFLRAESSKWGTTGANGASVTLNVTNQEIIGNIIIDDISSIDMMMTESYFKGTIANNGVATLVLDENSVLVLTSDSYLTILSNAVADNSNIYANGYKLYVAGEEVEINQGTAPESFINTDTSTTETEDVSNNGTTSDINIPVLVGCIFGGIIVVVAIVTLIIKLTKRQKPQDPTIIIDNEQKPTDSQTPPENMLQ